ncbi:MAG: hypothetical protein JNK21_14145 [Rhodospirillaceae bacterium]|nr:hypothetical protein [Rhodospirillaceae bacterium]
MSNDKQLPISGQAGKTLDTPADAFAIKNPGRSKRVHRIVLKDLVVHKYFDEEVLMRRADRIAQEVIKADLRDGEYFRQVKTGNYVLYLPKLTPAAGQLRTSVIIDRISREIRRIHPGSIALPEMADAMVTRRAAQQRGALYRRAKIVPASANDDLSSKNTIADVKEHRYLATEAFKLMSRGYRLRLEELLATAEIGSQTPIARFEPIWDVDRKLVSAFRCVLDESPSLISSKVIEPTGLQVARTDALTVLQAQSVLQSLVNDSNPSLMVVPVHLRTLENNAFLSAYIEAIGNVPEALRKFLVVEILSDLEKPTRFGLRHVMSYLRNRCRTILCRTNFNEDEFSKYADNGVFAVGLSAHPDYPPGQNLYLMNGFAKAAQRSGMRVYTSGLYTKSLLVGAVSSGYAFVSGAQVVGDVDYPFGARKATLDMFFRMDAFPSEPTHIRSNAAAAS